MILAGSNSAQNLGSGFVARRLSPIGHFRYLGCFDLDLDLANFRHHLQETLAGLSLDREVDRRRERSNSQKAGFAGRLHRRR